jgi:glycosyltransferase involved in cell wall biosynthesis
LAVNATVVSAQPAGLGVVAREVTARLSGLYDGLIVFSSQPALFPNARVQPLGAWVSVRLGLGIGSLLRFLWTQLALPLKLMKLGCGRLLSPNHELVLFCPCPQVVVIHDLLPLLFPGSYPRQRLYYRHMLPHALRRVERIVAVSENTKRDLVRHYGITSENVEVIYSGVDVSHFNPSLRKTPAVPYILTVGNQYPYKNLSRLLDAFASLVKRGFPQELLIVGKDEGEEGPSLRKKAGELNIEVRVRFAGYVSAEQLPGLYASADLFVFPSLYEGFGLPALEAMASGCPVAVSNSSSLPEICGDAACYFNPFDSDAMADVMAALLRDEALRRQLSSAGLARARLFNWDKTARQYAELLGLLVAS